MKTCQEITELYEKGKLTSITVSQKIAIRLHGSICKNCWSYYRESNQLDQLIRRRFKHKGKFSFSEDEKEALKSHLQR